MYYVIMSMNPHKAVNEFMVLESFYCIVSRSMGRTICLVEMKFVSLRNTIMDRMAEKNTCGQLPLVDEEHPMDHNVIRIKAFS